MKKTKILVSMAVAALAILGTYTTAFADAGAYAIKDTKTNIIRQYDLKSLTESFLSNKIGQGNDLLFKEFKEDQGKNGVHAIYDDSKKYISYAEAVKALEEVKISGKEFQLNGFLKEAKAGETPNYVYERKVSGEKVVNGLNITKEGFELDLSKEVLETYEDVKVVAAKIVISNGTVTGKLIVDAGKDAAVTVKNVKTDAITGLSGSLKLEGVEAKELVIEKSLSLNVDTASKLTKLLITAPKGTEIVLSGNLGAVEVSSAVKLTITAGSKVDVKIANDEAKEITVVAEAGSTVTTDQPITNTEGSGTITGPVTPTPGGGGTTTPTVDHTPLYTAINSIFAGVDSLDNKFNTNAGYLTISPSGNTVTITLPADKSAKDIADDIKASTTVASVSGLTEYINLVNLIKPDVNTGNILTALSNKLNSLGMELLYNTDIPFVQNLANLSNNTNKAQIVAAMNEVVIPEGITIKGYTVTSISVATSSTTNTVIYNSTAKKITKANIEAALGGITYEQAATNNIKSLLTGRTITVTLQDASSNTTTYTINFN